MNNDRIFVSTSYMNGSAEVAWAAAASGIFSRNDQAGDVDGELFIHMDGRATIKWSEGDDERCFVLVIDPQRKNGSYVTVYETEDQPPDENAAVVWQST